MHHFILISKGSVMMNITKGVNNDFLLKKAWYIQFTITEHDEFA